MSDYAVFTIDKSGCVSSWEPGGESMFGYAAEEIIGRPAILLYEPEVVLNSDPESAFRTADSEGRAEVECQQVHKDGARFWGKSAVVPLKDETGSQRGFVIVVHDLTGSKHTEESLRISEERYRAFAVNSSEAIWRFELEQPVPVNCSEDEQIEHFYQYGFLAECNDVMARMYEFSSPSEMVGIRLGDIVVRSNPENISFLRSFIRSGYQLKDVETVEADKEGKTKYFLNNLLGIVEGDCIFGAWGTNRDITQRKQAEENQTHLQKMAALGSLVANVAHEVRNPLFGISSVLDAFDARFGGQPEHQQYLSVLREELGRLNRLMEDLLDYGKPYSQDLLPGSINNAINLAIMDCGLLAEKGGVKIVNQVPDSLAPVRMDEKRLPQLFSNLIRNAVQHSSLESSVVVEASEIKNDNQAWIECRVIDSGPGFKSEDLPLIFEPFFTKRRGGTGLGLAIAQRIVYEHHGKILAGNRSEGGAEMVVRIPVDPINP